MATKIENYDEKIRQLRRALKAAKDDLGRAYGERRYRATFCIDGVPCFSGSVKLKGDAANILENAIWGPVVGGHVERYDDAKGWVCAMDECPYCSPEEK